MSSAPSSSNPEPLPEPTPLSAGMPKSAKPLEQPHAVGSMATDKVTVYRHSNLFYWWPVWAIGAVFSIITLIDQKHLAFVPADTVAVEQREVDVDGKGTREVRDVLILSQKRHHTTQKNDQGEAEPMQPTIFMTHYRWVGTLYVIVLLIVITITNISIRGLWTVFFMVSIIMLAIIFAAAGWWEHIFRRFNQLSIYINLGGYVFISAILFIQWAINFFIFDRQTYMIFTSGQVRVRLEIGGQETVFDTLGMVVERERGDLFRHWILGFGSGDLIIKPMGLEHPLLFPNVMQVESTVRQIERLTKQRVIMRAPDSKSPSA